MGTTNSSTNRTDNDDDDDDDDDDDELTTNNVETTDNNNGLLAEGSTDDSRMYTRPYSEIPSTASERAIRRHTNYEEKIKQRKDNTNKDYWKVYPEWYRWNRAKAGETLDGVLMSPLKVATDTLVTVEKAEAFIVDFLVKRDKRNGESGRLGISGVEGIVSALVDLRNQQIADDLEEAHFGAVNEQKGRDIKTPNVVAAINNVRNRTEQEDNQKDRTANIWKKKGYTMKQYGLMLNYGFKGGPGKYGAFNLFKAVLVRAIMVLQHNGVLRGASTRNIQMGDFHIDAAPDSESAMAGDQVKVPRALLPLFALVSHSNRHLTFMLLLCEI